MESKNRPYIGITDFTDANQAADMRQILDAEGSDRLLHVGVMMSRKTLHSLPTKWAGVFPDKEQVRHIFVRREGVLNVLHYADYDGLTTLDDLTSAADYAGPDVDALQLDMIWPDPHMLYEVKRHGMKTGRKLKFIIQVNAQAIERMGGDPTRVAAKLHEYWRMALLDYALFDLSGGQGKPMRPVHLLNFIWAAVEQIPDLSVAVAGGLGPNSVDLAEPVLRDLPETSLDAQSRLRLSGSALDPIDWAIAAEYLRQAARLTKKHELA